ncbi:hypothetical protein D3C85_900950 [compost metagenome]
MHHVADIALVDAHAEGDGGDDAVDLPGHEAALDRLARLMGHAGVIGAGGDAALAQAFGDLLGGLLLGDVDDARLPGLGPQPLDQPALLVGAADRLDQQVEVGPVEAGGDHIRRRDGELGLHVGDHRRRGGGGEQQHLGNAELALVVGQLEVVGTEVVAPLGDAVGFVDHQQGDRHLADEVAEAFVLQAFDRDHQDLQFAGSGPGHHCTGLFAALRRVDAGGADAVAGEKGQLILHQRQQRRDHQGQVWQVQGRQLVAQRLARPGGKDRRRRAPRQHGADRRFLTGSQLLETENTFESCVHTLSLR